MKINPDGSVDLEAGEYIPYICPRDNWPIEYDPNVAMVHCFHCGHIGTPDEFTREYTKTKRDKKV